ncbi:MAG: FAD-dependent oxidoreductase [Candidatus Hodgkinia cicadicola]
MANKTKYDVVVVGCGHAGLEAAIIASKQFANTAIIAISKSNIGKLSCNPSIGGVSKSHLVSELCCLGGEIGKISDSCALVAQTLNSSKSKMAQALRLQVDKRLFKMLSFRALISSKTKVIIATVTRIRLVNKEFEIELNYLNKITTKTLVLATGTFARSVCHVGECALALDRLTDKTNDCLYCFLKTHFVNLKRLKTGTSPRLSKASIDWRYVNSDNCKLIKYGFFRALNLMTLNMRCGWVHTNARVYMLVSNNVNSSSTRTGRLLAKGPRYCVSIEDKVTKFGNKPQKLILEPEATDTESVYVNGLSTSMPLETQLLITSSVKAFKNSKLLRAGYAVEYDSICSSSLKPTLECAMVPNVYIAGQINGTTGYEEASVQGFVAGLNAASRALTKREYIFSKTFSYIGVLINDITNSILSEPYRMLTTRAKNRTQLKQRNAALRLSPCSFSINALSRYREQKYIRWLKASKCFKLVAVTASGERLVGLPALSSLCNKTWFKLTNI